MSKCTIENCERIIHGHRLCSLHYLRKYRHGTTTKPKTYRQLLIEAGKSYCPQCDHEYTLDEFYKDKQAPNGIATYCKTCNKNDVLINIIDLQN